MLRELSVQNLALIEDISVPLERGFCVWTGETGAGKSLLLSALDLVLGGRANAALVRAGKKQAIASAIFSVDYPGLRERIATILESFEDEELIICRKVDAEGRSSAHVNGEPIGIRPLKALGALLVDLHGQDESISLFDSDLPCLWLDEWAGLADHRLEMEARRRAHLGLLEQRAELLRNLDSRKRERELLEFEIEELESLKPKLGEYQELTMLAQRLGQSERIKDQATQAFELLYESDKSAQGSLLSAAKRVDAIREFAPELASISADLARLAEETREIAYALRPFIDVTPGRKRSIDSVENRLAAYRKLGNRFDSDPDGLVERWDTAKLRLDQIDQDESDLKALDKPLAAARRELIETATALSQARSTASRELAKEVQSRLKPLGLATANVELRVEARPFPVDSIESSIPPLGLDHVEWMFRPNPGEPIRPLHTIASGGERSRVVLAIKATLAGKRQVPTLVFDEIDAGVGGRLGSALGKTLKELAKHTQVLCITHLPQLASHADQHWVIQKTVERGLTRTSIRPLDESERIEEVAAMIRGSSASESTRKEAESMLAEARPKVRKKV